MAGTSRAVQRAQGAMGLQEALETGLRFQHAGRLVEAEHVYRQILAAVPELPQALHLLSLLALQARNYDSALELIRRAIAAAPGVAVYHEIHGRVFKAMDKIDDAVACYRKAIEFDPGAATARVSLGIALKAQGRLDEAIECYRHALALDPDLPEAHHNLGNALWIKDHREGQWEQHIQKGLLPRLERAEALQKQGLLLREQLRLEEALACFRAALDQVPDLAPAHVSVGAVLLELKRVEDAEPCFRRAMELQPDFAPAHQNLGNVYGFQGRVDEADACYRRALSLHRNDGLKIRQALLLPVICQSDDDILASRSQYEKALDLLLEEQLQVAEPVTDVAATSFYLSYHGLDNRDLQEKLSRLALQATPALDWVAPHCRREGRRAGRIRVGFVSKYLYSHSIGRTTRGLIERLSREEFEVTALFVPPRVDDALAKFIRDKADACVDLPNSLSAAREHIAALELDVLFYQDIGMEPFTYYLAHARLAPVQCVSFGHPETTGIPNMDYFVSNDLFEPEDAPAHYSERLFLLRDLGTLAYYYRPEPVSPAPRAALGVADHEHFYLCPQTLFKFHPGIDAIIGAVLRADPAGRLVLVEGKSPHWGRKLRERFARRLPDVCERIGFVAQRSSGDFLRLVAAADVVLDTLHFNGMNTSLEAFACGVPVVTLPGAFQRARHTQGMYRKMGFTDCVARDAEDYADIALRLGCDRDFNRHARAEIAARCGELFEDRKVVLEFERFFRSALAAVSTAPKTNH